MSNQELLESVIEGVTKSSKIIATEILKKEIPIIGNSISNSSKITGVLDYAEECTKSHSDVACGCGSAVRYGMKTVIGASSMAMIETPTIISQVVGVAGLMHSEKVSRFAGDATADAVDYVTDYHPTKRQCDPEIPNIRKYDSEIPNVSNIPIRKYDSEIPNMSNVPTRNYDPEIPNIRRYDPEIPEIHATKQITKRHNNIVVNAPKNNLTPKQFGDFTVGLMEHIIKNVPYENIKIDPNSSLVIKNDKYTLRYNPKDVKFFHELIRTNQLVNRAVVKIQTSSSNATSTFSETVNAIKTDTIRFNDKTHKVKAELDSHCDLVHTLDHLQSKMQHVDTSGLDKKMQNDLVEKTEYARKYGGHVTVEPFSASGSYSSSGSWRIGVTYSTGGYSGYSGYGAHGGGGISCIIL